MSTWSWAPRPEAGPIPFRVFLDGEAADGAAGTDVAADGRGPSRTSAATS